MRVHPTCRVSSQRKRNRPETTPAVRRQGQGAYLRRRRSRVHDLRVYLLLHINSKSQPMHDLQQQRLVQLLQARPIIFHNHVKVRDYVLQRNAPHCFHLQNRSSLVQRQHVRFGEAVAHAELTKSAPSVRFRDSKSGYYSIRYIASPPTLLEEAEADVDAVVGCTAGSADAASAAELDDDELVDPFDSWSFL